jgi:tyrosyl-tRNA synthetase
LWVLIRQTTVYICGLKSANKMSDFNDELRWRGMIHDHTPGTEEQLNKEMTSGYIGFDPTANSLHIGNLVQIMMLVHLQRSGHKPYALVGGATGMVGDPSGKSEERNLLNEEELRYNEQCIKKQLEKFLDFEAGKNAAVMVNNYDWFKEIGFLNFLRDVGKHIPVSYMMAKDSVQNRLETGISFTEFSYQLLQGYDFYYLNQNHGVKLQMGGSDQWGNITTGTELIRRKSGGEAYALTTPLLTKTDGSKFGKTASGNVWLDPDKTSPYKFYQFWLNVSDDECKKLLRTFTLYDQGEIEGFEQAHDNEPHRRIMQKAVAEDVTVRVHSRKDYETAVNASEVLFGRSTAEKLQKIEEKTLLSVMEGVPQVSVARNTLLSSENTVDLLSEITKGVIFSSKGEARRMIKGGGVSINKEKITQEHQKPDLQLIGDKYLLVQKGKKNYYLIIAE